jgi:hypothetical protein
MTAYQPMACSRISPMNDLFRPNRNDAIDRNRLDGPTFHREIEKPAKHRRPMRRRWGGRLFALGGFVLLAGGLTLGGWGNYSLKQEVMATAKQQHDFVPSLHVATVEANPATVSVTLPARRPPSLRRTSMPAQPAILRSAMSTSGIASRQEICWRRSQSRSSTIRFRRTKRPSIS